LRPQSLFRSADISSLSYVRDEAAFQNPIRTFLRHSGYDTRERHSGTVLRAWRTKKKAAGADATHGHSRTKHKTRFSNPAGVPPIEHLCPQMESGNLRVDERDGMKHRIDSYRRRSIPEPASITATASLLTDTVLLRFFWCQRIGHDADRSPLSERRGNNAGHPTHDREQT
jgi:hypothetical protein